MRAVLNGRAADGLVPGFMLRYEYYFVMYGA